MEPAPPFLPDTPRRNADRHFERLVGELRALARGVLAQERKGHTLQATALVNEVYLRLRQANGGVPADASEFQRLAATAMRRVLVDHARARRRDKRGGGAGRVSLDALALACEGQHGDLLAVEEALGQLERRNPELAQLVQLRFYAGLDMAQIAAALGRSVRSVHRDWSYAKALLARALDGPEP